MYGTIANIQRGPATTFWENPRTALRQLRCGLLLLPSRLAATPTRWPHHFPPILGQCRQQPPPPREQLLSLGNSLQARSEDKGRAATYSKTYLEEYLEETYLSKLYLLFQGACSNNQFMKTRPRVLSSCYNCKLFLYYSTAPGPFLNGFQAPNQISGTQAAIFVKHLMTF